MPETETPAAVLRRAADKIRKLASEATPGPWTADASIAYGHRVGSTDEADWVTWTGDHGEDRAEPDAAYIAAMHPGVGVALADWLADQSTLLDANTHPGWQEAVAPRALAVARALLGETPAALTDVDARSTR